jgi:predicted RND superfamily exporter protein
MYILAVFLFLIQVLSKLKNLENLIEDMPKILVSIKIFYFFENEFNGVMPLEIMVDTQRKKGCYEVVDSTIDDLQTTIEEIPELSKPISILNIVKYSKKLTNGNPEYYALPTQEQSFILGYAKKCHLVQQ